MVEPVQPDSEAKMFEWLAKADKIMENNEYWLHPERRLAFDPESNEFYEFDAELHELLLKRQQR